MAESNDVSRNLHRTKTQITRGFTQTATFEVLLLEGSVIRRKPSNHQPRGLWMTVRH